MTVAIRPRIASVVGVVWLYLSAAWLPIGTMSMLLALGLLEMVGGAAYPFVLFAAWGALVTALAAFGGHAAYELLELRSRGRSRLEFINWLAFGLTQLFAWHVAWQLSSGTRWFGNERFLLNPARSLEVALFGLVLGLPYLFMAWKLRNAELRFAIRDAEGARAVARS